MRKLSKLLLGLLVGVTILTTVVPCFASGNDSDTVLLLHCNGTDESTTFTDDGGGANCPHTVTAVGTAQIDTAQKVFGTGSGLFDGNSDYLTLVDSDDWYFGSGDFTVDSRVNMSALPGLDSSFYIVGQTDTATDQRSWQIYVYTTSGGGHGWAFARSSNGEGGTTTTSTFADNTITTDTWYHIAVVRSGNDLEFFRGGTQIGSTVDLTDFTFHNSTVTLVIGSAYGGGAYFNGWIDELRISKGIARWTSDFTPYPKEYDTTSDYSGQAIVITQ